MRHPAEKRDRSALRITLIYAVASALWILFSDRLLFGIDDPDLLATLSIIKGWFFVLVTSILLYMLVRQAIQRIWHTEARSALVFDSVSDMIALFYVRDGRPGHFIDANEAACRLLGYSRDELLGMTPLDLVKPELRGEAWSTLDELWKTGRVLIETCLTAKDGRDIPAEISSRTVAVGGRTMAATVVRDITARKAIELERREEAVAAERDKRRFYRETILAVTGGKFELADPSDAEGWIRNPDLAIHVPGSQAMADARHQVLEYCRRSGMEQVSAEEFELAVGEALGNAVKHTDEGWVYTGREGQSVWVAIVDRGKGIDTFIIPNVALLAGFTTKASMGLGYTLILRTCDHVKLATGPSGTTVVMQKQLKPDSELEDRLAVFAGIE